MPEMNNEWIKEQLAAARVKVGSGKAILKLLETWESLPPLSEKMTEEVLTIFPQLAMGYALKDEDTNPEYSWRPLQPGQVVVGDVVRVKGDGFADKLGPIHNGRLGTVVAVRYGDVIFNSTDGKNPDLKGVHYSPYKLEKRYGLTQ
jgi:hypothetical protein